MNRRKLLLAPFLAFLCWAVASAQPLQSPLNEIHVMRSLRTLHSAEMTYFSTIGGWNFATLSELQQHGFIDPALASGHKFGYLYALSSTSNPPSFVITATPRVYRKTGTRSFFIDASGDIRGADHGGLPADANDPIIDDCTSGTIIENERCTIADMRAAHSAEETYRATIGNGNYGTLAQLAQAGLLRSQLSTGAFRGYSYTYLILDFIPRTQPASFKLWARPQTYGTTAIRSFYIDNSGVLRGGDKNGGNADQNDPPIID